MRAWADDECNRDFSPIDISAKELIRHRPITPTGWALFISTERIHNSMKCIAKNYKIDRLRELRPDDPDFSPKFDEIAKDLKEHIRSGHPQSKTRHNGKSCPGK
jgi:hypothetical protein